jgi:hypothetical protein
LAEAAIPDPLSLQQERDALRIQAAAVAAQQAALTEEEARLQQRRVALEQQEAQLADHLEGKRRQLLELRDQARQARGELREETRAHEERVAAATQELTRDRRELEEGQRHLRAERCRLLDLRRHLKKRWHRHWLAERRAQTRRETELTRLQRELEQELERVRQDQAALARTQLQVNGERELGRRQVQDAWQQLRQAAQQWRQRRDREQAELLARRRQGERREVELARAGRELDAQQKLWQRNRLRLQKEAEGLENRIRNYRRKILDQEQEALRLSAILRAQGTPDRDPLAEGARQVPTNADPSLSRPCAAPASELQERERQVQGAEDEVLNRLAGLEQLAEDLADQRLHLAEQWQWLLRTRHSYHQEQLAAAIELETLAGRLQKQEQALTPRDQALKAGEVSLRQRFQEIQHLRHHLEGCQARLRTRVAAWEGERDRLLADLRSREALAEKRLAVVAALGKRWGIQRRQDLTRLRDGLVAAEQLRQEYAALRAEGWRRQTALEQGERELAGKTLALEQYRQECIGQSSDSPAVERHLERLRRRLVSQSAASQRALTRERQAFQEELARFEVRCRQLHQHTQELAGREVDLAERQHSREHEQALVQDQFDQLRQAVQSLQAQRLHYENQVEESRAEVERIAHMLLDEADAFPGPVVIQAA